MPASESAKFLSFLCGGLSFVGCLVVTAYPEWLRNSQLSSAEFLRNQYIYHGIWWRCSSFQVGIFQCDHYDASLLGIPTDIQACRALMCIATIFSFLGTLIALLSLDCTTLIEPESKSKNYSALGAGLCFIITAELQAQRALMVIAVVLTFIGLAIGMISLRCTTMIENELKRKSGIGIAAGICFILAALSCGIAVSWFAWRITFEYFNVLYQEKEFKYEYGACLYIGWVATLFGACVLTTTIWFGVNVQRQYYDPAYKNDSFKYEYGSCLYVGWVAGFFTFISGLVLIIGSCRSLNSSNNDAYSPNKPYIYKPPASSTIKPNGEKTEYV